MVRRNRRLRVRKDGARSLRYPTREELDGDSNHAYIARKLEEMRTREELNRQRYKELKRAAKTGGLTAASRDGVFQFQSATSSTSASSTYLTATEIGEPAVSVGRQESAMSVSHQGSAVSVSQRWSRRTGGAQEKAVPEGLPSVTSSTLTSAASCLPSCSLNSVRSSISMDEILHILHSSQYPVYDNVDQKRIVYTPDEEACNRVMLAMEERALAEVREEAVDGHSTALQ